MKKEKLIIKTDVKKIPNAFHFDIQKNTKSNIFRDKTKYSRKMKHKEF